MSTKQIFSLVGIAFLSISGTALLAQSAKADNPAVWVFQFENDSVGDTDYDYTSGFLFRYISPDLASGENSERTPGFIARLFDKIPRVNDRSKARNWSVALGQMIMTPKDILATEPPTDDRLYAGWLYSQFSLQAKTENTLESWELTVGVVGPASLGEDLQRWLHELIDDYEPMGWDHQIENELGIGLAYRQVKRFRLFGDYDAFGAEFLPSFGAEVGNVRTAAQISGELRFGWNLPSDFGTSIMRAGGGTVTPYSSEFASESSKRRFSLLFFIEPEVQAVARDLFIDGNTWDDNSPITREPWLGIIRGGFQIGHGSWRLAYTHVLQSRSFKEQDRGHTYGSLTISHLF